MIGLIVRTGQEIIDKKEIGIAANLITSQSSHHGRQNDKR